MKTFDLTFYCNDFWGRPTYKSNAGHFYKDVDGVIHTTSDHTDLDGEPDSPICLKDGVELRLIKPEMKVIDLVDFIANYSNYEDLLKKIKEYSSNLLQEHPNFQTGQIIEFWGGYNNDIRFRSIVIGFDSSGGIYIHSDCYWAPIQDDAKRSVSIFNQQTYENQH